jgi:ribosome-binding ATPase YchF (GTP1/OBG family)
VSASGLDQIIQTGYRTLGLISYFTQGPKESRAWTVCEGDLAPRAAGVIHTDFERGFIRAQVMAYDDFVANEGEVGCREAGLLRTEGRDYAVCDGDVIEFLFNV